MSRKPWINAFFSYGADIIGNSRWIWFQQHILWHHPYTNHHGLDGDASSAEPALLFHDYGTDSALKKAHHAFQHVYMHLVLALYGPSIVLNPGYLTEMRQGPLTPDILVKENGYLRDQRSLAWCF